MDPGDRMVLWCEGGPSTGQATTYPPPIEIAVAGAIHVLVDDGPIEEWHYTFVDDRLFNGASAEASSRRGCRLDHTCIRRSGTLPGRDFMVLGLGSVARGPFGPSRDYTDRYRAAVALRTDPVVMSWFSRSIRAQRSIASVARSRLRCGRNLRRSARP